MSRPALSMATHAVADTPATAVSQMAAMPAAERKLITMSSVIGGGNPVLQGREEALLGRVASHLGVGGHRYVACYEVPSVSGRRAGSAPVGAVRPRPVRVEPRPGAALDVGTLERAHSGVQRPSRAVDRGQGCGAVAGCRVADGPAAGVARPRPGMAAVLQWHPQAPEVA